MEGETDRRKKTQKEQDSVRESRENEADDS